MNEKIWLSPPHLDGSEIDFIKTALDSNWVAPIGPHINQFERLLCAYTKSKYATALNSGTSAIHLALRSLNIQKGDIVLCQSLTFVATANPIIYQGAIPAFIDSELETWNMCPDALEIAIKHFIQKNKKPKAIIAVHLYGMPFLVSELSHLSKKYEIPLIEDAAEALGSTYKNRQAGTLGDLGIISFNGNKIITTSAGGAILSENAETIENIRYLATQARDPTPYYQHSEIGYNYAMSNICASIGIGQISVIKTRVQQRRENYFRYMKLLANYKAISFQPELEVSKSNRWLSCIRIKNEASNSVNPEYLRQLLLVQNIEARPVWKPLHTQPIFKGTDYFGENNAETLFNEGLCLPSGSNLSISDLERISYYIGEGFNKKG